MSVQFGRWNASGEPPSVDYLERVLAILSPYGPDGGNWYSDRGVSILFRAFHTTKESRDETQPCISPSGAVITWDGRLDNRAELIGGIGGRLSLGSSDAAIVRAAYERSGTDCFARFVGDWALAIWNPGDCSVILARDFVGTRHLYYSFDDSQIAWSTILDPFVLLAETPYPLDEEFLAGWLSSFPATHLTPYFGIHSVPPGSFVRLKSTGRIVRRYWDFDRDKRIRYRSDAEYEEHFRMAFGRAVERRLSADAPVLAELSGGMDSSSIVCMADLLIARGAAKAPRLDTLSYYNDTEPNWNERSWFTKVEEKRGRTGSHIDAAAPESLRFVEGFFAASPGAGGLSSPRSKQFAACMLSQGNRVVLSGIGGDEVTGGLPTPIPELEDLLASAQFPTLARQLKVWALDSRTPWFHLLLEATRGFLPVRASRSTAPMRAAPWLDHEFAKRQSVALRGYISRLALSGPRPSFQENLRTLDLLRRQLTCSSLRLVPLVERRYPFLDRDLLEFLFAIPREQLVRPGQRRSLMRRALVGIVPDALLNRRRKGFLSRTPVASVAKESAALTAGGQSMLTAQFGIIDAHALALTLDRVRSGQDIPIAGLLRMLRLEYWLRHLQDWNFLPQRSSGASDNSAQVLAGELPRLPFAGAQEEVTK